MTRQSAERPLRARSPVPEGGGSTRAGAVRVAFAVDDASQATSSKAGRAKASAITQLHRPLRRSGDSVSTPVENLTVLSLENLTIDPRTSPAPAPSPVCCRIR
jgi:hypothetical protein